MKLIQGRRLYPVLVRFAVLGLCWVAATRVTAQTLQTGFESPDYQGSAEGVVVTGQQGWYRPIGPSQEQYIYTYDGNALGLPPNPFGDLQFLGAQVASIAHLARAQMDFDWSAASVWTVSYDFAAGFNGTLPATDYVGSFSLQDSNARYFLGVNIWVAGLEGTQWSATYVVFDANGVEVDFVVPGPEWQNLEVDHWYRQSTTFDLVSNTITEVSIADLDSGDTASFAPCDWYLAGGAGGGGLPLPTSLRFFVGGEGTPGNVQGWDNLLIASGDRAPTAPKNEQSARRLSLPGSPGAATH